ncbi:SUMO1 sentrin specific peptidase 1, variant 2 [Cadophora gregata f. sp. sojae]|nr:SUMO1 sentrin specific peptidase 1, variant 2 [Cadophora gregata f. sp. sojae]
MDVKNENESAVNELRRLIILHQLLIEFNYLKTSFENSVSPEGKRAATSAIDKIAESQEHDRKFVESRLKRSRRLKKTTDKLDLATILVAGRHLTTLLQESTMNASMFDCLSFYILEEFPFVAKIIEALGGVATSLVDNVPLPPWEEFQVLLNKLEGLKLMKDSRKSNVDDFSTGSWIDKVRNTKTSSCLDITSHDLSTLLRGHCLNDVVVNSTLELLAGESRASSGLIYIWNSFLFTNIAGRVDVSQWTIKAGMNSLFDYDIHLVPINLTGHWILAKVDLKNRDITTYDSLWRDIGHEQSIYTNLEEWVGDNVMINVVPRPAFRYICSKVRSVCVGHME